MIKISFKGFYLSKYEKLFNCIIIRELSITDTFFLGMTRGFDV
jgi:hypothetical protein